MLETTDSFGMEPTVPQAAKHETRNVGEPYSTAWGTTTGAGMGPQDIRLIRIQTDPMPALRDTTALSCVVCVPGVDAVLPRIR